MAQERLQMRIPYRKTIDNMQNNKHKMRQVRIAGQPHKNSKKDDWQSTLQGKETQVGCGVGGEASAMYACQRWGRLGLTFATNPGKPKTR